MAILKSKSGSSFNTKTGVKTSSSGQTTQVRAAMPTQAPGESRSSFLKSLNKKGHKNYQPTPDDVGYENMDALQNVKAAPDIAQAGKIDASQPNPATVDATAGLPGSPAQPSATQAPFAEALKGIDQNDRNAVGSLAQKYQAGFQSVANTQAPSSMGEANSVMQQTIPAPKQDTSIVDAFIDENPGLQTIKDAYAEYYSPEKQKTSLMDTYNKLYKKSGLDQLDDEIIDAKTVIEGTEDDIRNEIEQAGGFGTDSQVQAMALSRNKVLLKNYNNLVSLRESKAENLNTMMSLAEKDRAYADQQFDKMLNFEVQMLNYRDKFVQNARDQYNKYSPQQLQSMLSGNPRQLAFAEQILGVGQGGIAKLASAPLSEEDQLNLELKRSALKTDKLQRANIQSQIDERSGTLDVAGLGVDEKTMGKIQSSPEYKTINGVLPAITAVKSYLDSVNDTGTFEMLNGTKAGQLKSSYGNAIAAWKTLAALGALSGADFGLAENVIPAPGLLARNSKVKAQLNSAIDNGVKQVDMMTTRLSQNYPKGAELLNRQADDLKVIAYPDRFKVAPDGQVYEIIK